MEGYFIESIITSERFIAVGTDGCISITEHSARGEGDKWYYDIEFDDGHIIRSFDFEQVVWQKGKGEGE